MGICLVFAASAIEFSTGNPRLAPDKHRPCSHEHRSSPAFVSRPRPGQAPSLAARTGGDIVPLNHRGYPNGTSQSTGVRRLDPFSLAIPGWT